MSSSLGSRFFDAAGSRSREFLGGVLGCVGLLHFAAWATIGGGASALADLETGHLSLAAGGLGGYASAHPAYVLAFVAGIAVVCSARQ
ncbi:hypothetical protein MBEHAL_1802 [Halarchaeum acidiphilum MH1-52-1]|uniref:Uncharacterized protein n=1 Tax=Halarchaeum acidiphilum MH1-52-1 TaxID=1261545 RepID=U2YW71_9EURY|nr:hypothetical protein [Halarchaeum acidiphilum]GAD53042.1 hypothetical protein MBEHAL_1802 [Halarchaeum acidiphilum MH1-52-1]